MNEQQTDFIIIGAGLVGLTLAKALGNRGYEVVVLERKARLDPTLSPPLFEQRAIVLSETSCRILKDFGLESIYEEAEYIHSVHVSEHKSFGKLRFHHKLLGLNFLGRVSKAHVLAERLLNAIEAPVRFHHDVEINHFDLAQSIVNFSIGETDYCLKGRCLIAADGMQSQVVESLGLVPKRKHYGQSALICNIRISKPHQCVAVERFLSDGTLAFLPVSPNEVAMVWCLPHQKAKFYAELGRKPFFEKLNQVFGYRFGYFEDLSPRHIYPLSSSFHSVQAVKNTLVLGNAAHTLHPVAGQGFNLSLRDISGLMAAFKHLDPDFSNVEDCLKRYLSARAADQSTMHIISDILPRLFLRRYRLFKPLRALTLLLVDCVPLLKKPLARRFVGDRNKHRD